MLDAPDARRVRVDDDGEVGGFVKPSFFSVWMWCDRSRTPGVTREAIEGNDSKIFPRRVVEETLKTKRGAWGLENSLGSRPNGGRAEFVEFADKFEIYTASDMGAFRYWFGPAGRRAWDDTARLIGGLPVFWLWLILFLLSLLPWAWSLSVDKPLIPSNRQTLLVLAVQVLLLTIFLAHLFAAPARIHADQVQRIADMESRLTPKLDLEFEPPRRILCLGARRLSLDSVRSSKHRN